MRYHLTLALWLLLITATSETSHTPYVVREFGEKPLKTEYDEIIKKAVETHLPGYDWRIYKSLLFVESGLNPKAVSPTGAGGLAQFMPETWEEWRVKAGYPEANRFEPEAAIMVGAAYMAELLKKWKTPRPEIDRNCLAMLSYNAGFKHVLTAQKLANGSIYYKDIVSALPKVPGLSEARIRDGQAYAKKIYKCYIEDVTG